MFLDDNRDPNRFLHDLRTWVVVRSYREFVDIVTEFGIPIFVSFDHDLAEEHYPTEGPIVEGDPRIGKITLPYDKFKEKTGYDCAVWLVQHCMKMSEPLPKWQVHSMNPVGRANITKVLEMAQKIEL